ncbi:MAG: hypothetical protein H6581_25615 [Bacteroidia bacterium]|nr:hypothetical protein [Bacteroidia bacterium]
MRTPIHSQLRAHAPKFFRLTALFAAFFLLNFLTVQAQVPGQRDFDVTNVSAYNLSNQTAEGTSNGLDWKICATAFSNCCGTSTSNGFQGFNSGNFSPPVANEDNLHIGGEDYTITFSKPVSSIVFYLRENGGTASVDFGMTPTVISGGANLNIVGTRIFPNTLGGAIRLDNVNSRTITGLAGAYDGMHVAFYVESLAPGPAIAPGCPGQQPVPTLSQWGLIILGLLILCVGAVVMWQRSRRLANA